MNNVVRFIFNFFLMDSAQTVMTVHYLLKAAACEKKEKKKKGCGAGETQM